MQTKYGKRTGIARFVALACFFALLLASFGAPIHKHASTQDATCLICHASDEQANTVAIASDAGKLRLLSLGKLDAPEQIVWISDGRALTRSPRAPPQ